MGNYVLEFATGNESCAELKAKIARKREAKMSFFMLLASLLTSKCQFQALVTFTLHLTKVREISIQIAVKVAKEAYKEGNASTYPEPEDMEAFIRNQLYDYTYTTSLPARYEWPEAAFAKLSV